VITQLNVCVYLRASFSWAGENLHFSFRYESKGWLYWALRVAPPSCNLRNSNFSTCLKCNQSPQRTRVVRHRGCCPGLFVCSVSAWPVVCLRWGSLCQLFVCAEPVGRFVKGVLVRDDLCTGYLFVCPWWTIYFESFVLNISNQCGSHLIAFWKRVASSCSVFYFTFIIS